MSLVIGLLSGIVGGGAGVFVLQNVVLKSKRDKIIQDAESEGENLKKEKILQAKERFLKLKEEHEVTMKEKERRLQSTEDRARAKARRKAAHSSSSSSSSSSRAAGRKKCGVVPLF